MSDHRPLDQLARKLETRALLDSDDRAAIDSLPYIKRAYEPPAYILREGEPARKHASFILSGLAFRQKITAEGSRQIVSIHMAGDFLDFQHLFLSRADYSAQALTGVEVIEIDREALETLILERPAIARAMWTNALIDASISREWILNVGRRDSRARIAHLLCEFAVRMEAAGIGEADGYDLPMTQEQIADAVGLTPVHVNRTLRSLVAEGLIHRDKRHLRFANWERIKTVGDFSALYLHMDRNVARDV